MSMIRSERSENMPKKKVNPRRIPMAKKELDTDAIIDETMKEDMAHAWLLVAAALVEQELIKPDEIGDLAEAVNRYIEKGTHQRKKDLERAEKIVVTRKPRVDPNRVRSAYDLEKFKKKVERIALHTGLCVVFLGLDSTGRFTEEEMKRAFFLTDLTLAEIDGGVNSYEEIERELLNKAVKLEMLKDA